MVHYILNKIRFKLIFIRFEHIRYNKIWVKKRKSFATTKGKDTSCRAKLLVVKGGLTKSRIS